jgi:hypothetical protein
VLLKLGNALHLFYALNIHRSRMESGANGRPVTVHSSFGQVFELLSDDGGGTWSVPELVVRDDRHPDSAAVEALAAATSADGLELFIVSPSGLGLSHLRKSPGSEWSDPQPVLPPRPRFLAASFHVSDVAVNGDGEDAVVAWIDTRHRATSRRIWSPLGGFPWSDHPDYADNDVFALPLDTLTSGRAEASMARLTAPRGYADRVAVAAGPAQTFVVWSGRARVGRYQDSFGAVSELFCDVLSPSFVRQR